MTFLIQRIIRNDRPQKTGVDKYFHFDYMGAAEFEWGELPRALKSMRAADNLCISKVVVEHSGKDYTGWAVSSPAELDEVKKTFADQLGPRSCRLKEASHLGVAYGTDSFWGERSTEVIGWWAIDAKVPWVLFMKKTDAKNWMKGLKEKKDGES